MSQIFISHVEEDASIALEIALRLEEDGYSSWLSEFDVPAGSDYPAEVAKAITNCMGLLIVISPQSLNSNQVYTELLQAFEDNKQLVPVRHNITDEKYKELKPNWRYCLKGAHSIEFSPEGVSSALNLIVHGLKSTGIRPGRKRDQGRIEKIREKFSKLLWQKGTVENVSISPDGRRTIPGSLDKTLRMWEEPKPESPAIQISSYESEEMTKRELAKPERIRLDFPFDKVIEQPVLLLNHTLSKYTISEFLGAGGTGLVFNSLDKALGREVCIKIFYPLTPDLEGIAKIVSREVKGVAALDHPHLVKIFQFGLIHFAGTSSFYLATEFIHGESLSQWYSKLSDDEEALPKRLRMAYDIATALSYAHNCRYIDEIGIERRGVLHGDIKPSNIMVRANDSPIVLDFMLPDVQYLIDREQVPEYHLLPMSKEDETPQTFLARMGFDPYMRRHLADFLSGIVPEPETEAFGTYGFMAPEQEGRGVITVKSDIFSLGVTFCLMFYPYGPERNSFLVEVRKKGDNRFSELDNLLVDMLQSDPALRPRDMDDVAQRLAIFGRNSGWIIA